MNIFNRVVMVVLLLVALSASAIFTVVPPRFIALLTRTLEALSRSVQGTPLLSLLVGLGLVFLWIFLLTLEVWRPPRRTVRVLKVSGGEAELTIDAIAQRLVYRVDQLADVVSVRPKVSAGRRGVDVQLDLETSPDIDVPAKTEEVCGVVRDVIEERMGLKLRRIRVKVRHAPYPEQR